MNFAKVCCVGLVLASGMLMAAERISLDRGWAFALNGGAVQKVDVPHDWGIALMKYDYSLAFARDWKRDLTWTVLRDRNHPSLVMWEIGNEIEDGPSPQGIADATALAKTCRALDPTRPVMAAVFDLEAGHRPPRAWWRKMDAIASELDIFGYNYLGNASLGMVHYTEKESYYGYRTPKAFPWHGAVCGDIDVTGWRKPVSHLRETLWNANAPTCLCVLCCRLS